MADEPKLTEAEWVVMRAVWAGAPATARDVLARADGPDWAYTTVKTLLGRLVDKGALAVERRGNTSYYAPIWQPQQARRSALRSLLRSAFDGSFGGLVHHLATDEELSKREREQLAELLRHGARRKSR
ncbi:MAG: BlaI/MecI/CopY family transcriptional regulator [Planctomycetes bacterium]|nr:BlaI/MecI/CopY family transcriptional regulator [Planctomycetota bacterium]